MKNLVLALAITSLSASQLAAQNDSTLIEAVRLATEGQVDSAHAIVDRMMEQTSPSDSTYPEILFTAGLLSSDPDSARSYFTMVGIEYSQSDWADRALLRLAQLAFAEGNPGLSLRRANRVIQDYPFSEVRGDAAYWAGRSQIALGSLPAGCALLGEARNLAGEDVELANRAAYYMQRCVAVGEAAEPDSAATDTTATGTTRYSVQVAALRSPAAVDQAMRSLVAAGFEPRVSRDPDGFLRVKVGEFLNRRDAQQMVTRIKREVGGEPFVVEEN